MEEGSSVGAEALPGSVRLGRWARGRGSAESGCLAEGDAGISSHERLHQHSAGLNTHLPAAHELADAKYLRRA